MLNAGSFLECLVLPYLFWSLSAKLRGIFYLYLHYAVRCFMPNNSSVLFIKGRKLISRQIKWRDLLGLLFDILSQNLHGVT